MHPFPVPMLMGRQASLIGYSNVPTVGALPWSVPFPTGTQVGDMMVIVVADTSNLIGNVTISSSGATTTQFFAAGPTAEANLTVFFDQIDSTDLSSGIQITGTAPSTLCGAVFVFRGPVNIVTGSNDVTNVALSNGATATLTGFTPDPQHVANLAILMTKSATFTATAMVPWQNGLVNGTNASFLWQILDGGYGGQNIEWSNVQNMGYWCAISEDLYR